MEDEERQKKLEAGKAKLAEYRQRKAYVDSQKKQKKKKKKKSAEDSEGDSQGKVEVETAKCVGGEESSGWGRDGSQERKKDSPTSEFTFTRTLHSGETVKCDQTYTIQPESEVSTTAEDCSSEDEVEPLQRMRRGSVIQDMEDALAAKCQVVEELTQDLEEVRVATEGVQQLQDFETALKQRDGIITQLTANLQQAREEKDEIMKEFLELTEKSQKLHIQFQQLQAGETMRNTSHSSTAADLLQARQQLSQYQQRLEEMNAEVKMHQERSNEQLEHIQQLQLKLSETEMSGRRSEESFTQRISEKDLLIAEQEKVILSQVQLLTQSRMAEESFAQTLKEKNQLISEQTATIKEHEMSLMLLREEVVHMGRTADKNIIHQPDEKDLIIVEQERVISERDCSLTQLEDELESSEKRLHDLQQQMAAKESELEKYINESESSKSDLERCRAEIESYREDLEKERMELEICKSELVASRQKERMSSNEIMQLMGTVEDLQKRVHQGTWSEKDTVQKMQEDTVRKLDILRAELDEMYGQQIVQMKQELNLQHAARVEQMTMQHRFELESLQANLLSLGSSAGEVDTLNAKISELQMMLEDSQAVRDAARNELTQVTQEKFNLQVKVENLLKDLHSAEEKVEQVSLSIISQENNKLHCLQETIDYLRSEIDAAREEAKETEAKHDSEITNYKIKLEMLEREKDAVLDRMAESQEAELERLRTQLLFSHEEELTNLREELQRENFLNTENLLNEALVKHEKMMDELRGAYEEKLHLLQSERATYTTERNEFLQQILELKEHLQLTVHSSKADVLVQQLQELQVELAELRKGGEKTVEMENEIQTLLKKTKALENTSREKEDYLERKRKEHELEKVALIESNNTLKDELVTKIMAMETLAAENNRIQQQVVELTEEIEKQRTTFSFAEKNFEVNYQELKEEYACLIEAKTQLEERTQKETLEFEAEISRLQSQIQELQESSRDIRMVEKDTREVMEKLSVTLNEKEVLTGSISEVTKQLMFSQNKVEQLEEELLKMREENTLVIARNESLEKELEEKEAIIQKQARGDDAQRMAEQEKLAVKPVCPSEGHRVQIQSLHEEIKALQSLLHTAESERDSIRQILEFQKLSPTPSPVAILPSTGERPVELRTSPHKSTGSGSNRRKRRQRSKQERRRGAAVSDCREEQKQEEEEEEQEAAVEEERATSAAAINIQPQMESQVMSCSQESAGKEESTDGYQGDEGRDYINKSVSSHGMSRRTEPVVCQRAKEEETAEHGKYRLQMEAQHISLSQIHAAQPELLQEEVDTRTHSLELKLQEQSDHEDRVLFDSKNISEAIQKECSEIIQYFQKMFSGEFSENSEAGGWSPPSVERKETSESTSTVMEARELYRDLQQVRETIEREHLRLSQLQGLLRTDGNKMVELQKAYDELKSSSEQLISDLRVQVASLSSSTIKDLEEQTGVPSTQLTDELRRLRAEEQEKQLRLEESHRAEVEHLRAHYQQQATETEERYLTELFMLQQQLQQVTSSHTHLSLTESSHDSTVEQREELQKVLSEEELSEGAVELHWPSRSAGLQALKKALYHKYVEEVAALKEQHNRELKRLREERGPESRTEGREEKEQDRNGINNAGRSTENFVAAGPVVLEKKQERLEEEVAKAIVQMSVQFAQQTELARINKRACQRCTSMQTQSDEDEVEERGKEVRAPTASPSSNDWLEKVERELEDRNAEIRKLKDELQKTKSGPEQNLKKKGNGQEEEDSGVLIKKQDGGKLSVQDDSLSSDTDTERNALLKANKNLSKVLVEVLKTTAAAEETLVLHMKSLCDSSESSHSVSLRAAWDPLRPRAAGHAAEGSQGSRSSAEDASTWSREMEAGESLKMSQQMIDDLLFGVGTQLESEEYVMSISSRLQTALEKMLTVISDTTNQVEHARVTQTELMRESFRHNQEMNELLQKQEELQERLMEEAGAREQLALKLHRAEGLIDGYTGERAALEQQLRQKEELQLNLEQELQVTSSRLHELEQERLQMQEERELLSRQQDAMKEHAGPRELRLVEAAMVAAPEADLLEETEKLMKEKVEVQRQAEKENSDFQKQVKLLEAELEEQVSRVIELEQTQRMERGDLQQQIQALEKQLEKNRRFLDEQAVDREHERDFFQQEIQKLEQQLKNPQKHQTGSEQRNQEVDQLTSQLKERADWCSELLLSSEQLRREVRERDEEIDKLESRIRELEQALLASAESLEKVEQKKQHASITEAKQATLESQLQTEREALERKEKEICNLEEQLEQFREELENKSEEVQQLHMQLEIQSKEISSQQEYLEDRESLLQVMEAKDREIALLNEQITKLQHMETTSDNKELDGREELVKDLESQVECLRSEQQRLKKDNEEELDQLNAVIEKLQQELINIEQKQAEEEEEDTKVEIENSAWRPNKEEYEEMKQRMDLATKELQTLKAENTKLLEMYLHLKEGSESLAATEQVQCLEAELEDALIEKTAGLVVMQAQVQALEKSATSRVEELDLHIRELEDVVEEKECEVRRFRLLLEQTQIQAEGLQQKASNLEKNLREKMVEALVSQATLDALQQQQQQQSQVSKESQDRQEHVQQRTKPNMETHAYDFGDFDIPKMDLSEIRQSGQVSTGKVVHLTQRLRELEVGLSGMQKDQELQKQLLSSSEEEVLEYERRLSVLMDLLTQMRTRTHQRTSPAIEFQASCTGEQPAVSDIKQDLQEVRDEVLATNEQLVSYKDSCGKLQEELQEKNVTIEKLQDQLHKMTSGVTEETKVSELQEELMKAQAEAAATKEELNSCCERLEKLQELLQEREMTIAHLNGELFQVKSEEDRANMAELLQEVQNDAASTKEALNSYRQSNEKLQDDLHVHKVSLSKLEKELQEVRQNLDTTKEELWLYRQHNEKLKEDLHVHEVSKSKLEEELQEMKQLLDTTKEELDLHKQHNEKLQEDYQVSEVSKSKLKEELQEVRQNLDTSKEESGHHKQHNEKLQEELKDRELSISKLEKELQEMRQNLDTNKEEHGHYRQYNEKLKEDLHVHEVSKSKLEEELQEMKQLLDTTKEELDLHKQHNEKLQEDYQVSEVSKSKLKEELKEVRQNLDTSKEESGHHKQHNEKLQKELKDRELSICKLEEELQEMRQNLDTNKEEHSHYRQHNEKLQEELKDRELSISKLEEELQEMRQNLDTNKEEHGHYRQYNEKLKEDLHVHEVSKSKLEEELQEMRQLLDTTKEELDLHKQHNEKLQEDYQVSEVSKSKLKEELQEVRQNLDTSKEESGHHKQHNEKLQEELKDRELSISKLKEELQEMRQNLDTNKEEHSHYRQYNEKLQEELQDRELSMSKPKEELKPVQKELIKTVDSGAPSPSPSLSPSPYPQPLSSVSPSSITQPSRKGIKQPLGKGNTAKDKPSLSRKNSATSTQSSSKSHSTRLNSRSVQQRVAVTHTYTQTEPLHMADLTAESKSRNNDEMGEVIEKFQEKIIQMQELHAAEILDMEARHITESENLRRDTQALEGECKALKTVIDKLHAPEAHSSRQARPTAQFKDGYMSDSSSDYSQRTGLDVPSLQLEIRTTPEGARIDTDDPLQDRIKTLLREVHQEGMQVLSLSELPLSEGESGNIPAWMKERDDLLETVESLKSLITQMQTQPSGSEDWRGKLLDAVRQVFTRERNVLKSALYHQLDMLDPSDAIIHLNQLERRLAEQDAQHREAMGSLHTAERSSLISEIHQLRDQLERVHHGDQIERSPIEQKEGRPADGAVEGDRLLVDELKGELSQTKLELETTLKAQHKHLKELDTLRSEVSQKAAEVDALNDQLTEEKKKSRDLQWAIEKERCHIGRNEENQREELEDMQLTVEEQKRRIAQLTVTLEQERQTSLQLSEQSEQERLSLHRRLQELKVQLETEQAKALEMSTALGRERELRTGVPPASGPSKDVEEDKGRQEEEVSLLEKLQQELDDKHAQVVHLLSQVEVQRLEVVRKDEELTLGSQRYRREQEALQVARTQLERLETQVSEMQEQLEKEMERRKSAEEEKERLEERLNQLREQRGTREPAVWHGESTDRTKDWVFQQASGNTQSPTSSISPVACGTWRTVDKILCKLHLISSKVRSMASTSTGSLTAEVNSEELSWIQSSVDDVITMLQQAPGLPSVPESVSPLAGGSSNNLTQRLLRQNAELTGFVSRLTEEKNDLRNQTLRLEEEVRRYRQAGQGMGDSFSSRRGVSKLDSSGMLLSQEREAWTREKVRLERALHHALAQVARLRGEIRTETLREITGPEADNAALKRMYGKYLRSESFRKALIYQKKYLLLLLGGFQECEEATLLLLSRMGAQPSPSNLESISQRRRGLMRFRSAVRVSIALSRMRFLVKRWHKATGMSSTSSCNISKNGAGQTLGTDLRDSPYLRPGSVEMSRERGGGGGASSGRGRSGRESPRSAASSTHHRFHLTGDHGALTCSHLQSYDPDRALTDYISRLEALQRRLGSVTSGATSYAQLQFGLRR